ncbi:MAG: DUF2272 domain-containing protein [Rhodoplanes sp.]
MSFEDDFKSDVGWSVADTNVKLNRPEKRAFCDFLKSKGVSTIIRYYASSERDKTISIEEAKFLCGEYFNLLPVFQDRNRLPVDFGEEKGKANASSARAFAKLIGQPEGSTILFAVDADFSENQTEQFIIPYFKAVKAEIGESFRLGAYGSGHVLKRLLAEGLIQVPWISMSRLFLGTKEFFNSPNWFMRQVPPDHTHPETEVTYDRNVLNRPVHELGAFRLDTSGEGQIIRRNDQDASLGGGGGLALAMVNAYVSTDGLNLREKPDGTIIRELTIGQAVVDLGPADVEGWRRVQVDGVEGVAFGKYLRPPVSKEIEALLRSVVREWVRFDKGHGNEEIQPYRGYVHEMWESIGEDYDGASTYPDGSDVPWSAAFISFVVRNAGVGYEKFKFAAAHSVFAHDAIQARFMQLANRPFWGYRRTEQRPTIGDIIVRNRAGNDLSFDFAENHSQYVSHSDVVVEVTEHVARVMGGNVSDTVSFGTTIQEYTLNEDGFVKDGQKVIAILKNRASDV